MNINHWKTNVQHLAFTLQFLKIWNLFLFISYWLVFTCHLYRPYLLLCVDYRINTTLRWRATWTSYKISRSWNLSITGKDAFAKCAAYIWHQFSLLNPEIQCPWDFINQATYEWTIRAPSFPPIWGWEYGPNDQRCQGRSFALIYVYMYI